MPLCIMINRSMYIYNINYYELNRSKTPLIFLFLPKCLCCFDLRVWECANCLPGIAPSNTVCNQDMYHKEYIDTKNNLLVSTHRWSTIRM